MFLNPLVLLFSVNIGGPNTLCPPNQIIGGAMAPLPPPPPPIAPPMLQPGFVRWVPPASHDHFNHCVYQKRPMGPELLSSRRSHRRLRQQRRSSLKCRLNQWYCRPTTRTACHVEEHVDPKWQHPSSFSCRVSFLVIRGLAVWTNRFWVTAAYTEQPRSQSLIGKLGRPQETVLADNHRDPPRCSACAVPAETEQLVTTSAEAAQRQQ